MTSASLTVSNSAPSAFNPLIEPIEPAAGADDLVCTAQTSDADNDPVSLSYEWTVDGVLTTFTSDTVPATETADGEVWVCTMTPNDGTDDGTPVSAQVEIGADAEGAVGMGCASAGHVTNSSHANSHSACLLSDWRVVSPPMRPTHSNKDQCYNSVRNKLGHTLKTAES